ncbi:MAG: polysaccharide deacetylase family protein, partial [Thiohalomonadales bacterium]|nr:polysaccharide deacetylase family protein [Thiohalomonadales bacterium]
RFYQPMTLLQLVQRVFESGEVPRNAIVITVDDGYRDFHDVAWPILKEFNVPATLFVTTGFVSGDLWLWPDQVTWLFSQAPELDTTIAVGDFELSTSSVHANRRATWQSLVGYLLSIPDKDKHRAIQQLADSWSLSLPNEAPDDYAACSWEHLRDMEAAGIEIGGHTVTHPSLGCVDESQARQEIQGCLDMLNKQLGARDRTFCYPNGEPSDFSIALKGVVQSVGFSAAVAAFADSLGLTHRYSLRRHSSGEDRFQFYKSVSGVELLGHRLRKTVKVLA